MSAIRPPEEPNGRVLKFFSTSLIVLAFLDGAAAGISLAAGDIPYAVAAGIFVVLALWARRYL